MKRKSAERKIVEVYKKRVRKQMVMKSSQGCRMDSREMTNADGVA